MKKFRWIVCAFVFAGLAGNIADASTPMQSTVLPSRCLKDGPKVASLAQAAQVIVCATSERRLLIVGEMHGTNETPDLVAALVRDSIKHRPVQLGLEMPAAEQSALQAYIRSTGGAPERAKLLQGRFWTSQDGRSSTAMLRLLDSVRKLRIAGANVDVFAMEPIYPDLATMKKEGGAQFVKEAGMAQSIRHAMDVGSPDQLVIVLMGNFHSRYGKDSPADAPDHSVTERLASESPYVVLPSARQMEAWVCLSDGCGVHSATDGGAPQEALPRFVTDINEWSGPVEVELWLPRMTAALPARKSGKPDGGRQGAK